MKRSVFQAKDLHVAFGVLKAADGVTMDIYEGEMLAVIGPNGSGKTTLLNVCTGYIKPQAGSVHLNGRDITQLPPRSIARLGVARAFQIPQLFAEHRVIDNIMLALAAREGLWNAVRALETPARRAEANELLALFGMSDDAERIASTLPEGHRKLLDIAVALALRPHLLLLDEPTSGVSAIERFSLMESLMKALRHRKITTLFVEHDMDVVERYADRVLVWNFGKVMAEGSPREVFDNPQVRQSVVGVA
jgi:branched-chain amino acid transport system ATP-binding protein